MSAIDWRRAVLVPISLIELNDIPFRIGYPCDSNSFNEVAHIERSQHELRVVPHLRQLRVQVVDEECEVAVPAVGEAVLLGQPRRRRALRGEELEREPVRPDDDDLAGTRQVDALPLEPEVLRVPALDGERVLAVERDVVEREPHYCFSSSRSMILRANW